MTVRRSDLMDPAELTARVEGDTRVACQSHLVDDLHGARIEDVAVPGSYPCPDPGTWRVTYAGALTDTGAAALRTKCATCAGSALESFDHGAVTLRPLA